MSNREGGIEKSGFYSAPSIQIGDDANSAEIDRVGAPLGNKNAWKHGWYSAAAARRAKLVRELVNAGRSNERCDE